MSFTAEARFTNGSSCIGSQSVSGTLTRRFIGGQPLWDFQSANANGYFFYVELVCGGEGWATMCGFNTMNMCLFGINGPQTFTGYTTGSYPLTSSTVNGECRLASASFSEAAYEGFGLILNWTLTFNYA